MPNKEKVIKGLECHYEALESSCDICPYKDEWTCQLLLCKDAFTLLKEREANMESVVRCKECKWYQAGIDINGKPFTRCNGNARVYGRTMPDWFCADGERKESRWNGD